MKRVLVVDDDAISRKLTSKILGYAGYQVEQSSNGLEALQLMRTAPPCLVLVDLQLPAMDGLELTRCVKADPSTRHIPVVAVTAHAMKGTEQSAMAAGCDGFMTKPLDTRRFTQVIASFLAPRAK
ncbi:MAG TPA: response regulator [Opitutaceae bacterium]|jgi:CheY-like chemotaxis protein